MDTDFISPYIYIPQKELNVRWNSVHCNELNKPIHIWTISQTLLRTRHVLLSRFHHVSSLAEYSISNLYSARNLKRLINELDRMLCFVHWQQHERMYYLHARVHITRAMTEQIPVLASSAKYYAVTRLLTNTPARERARIQIHSYGYSTKRETRGYSQKETCNHTVVGFI